MAAENTRDPKSDNGTSGGTARRSTHTNATAATTASSPAAYEIGPAAGEVSAKVSPARATTVRKAPTMSKRPVRGERLSGVTQTTSASTTRQSGTLIPKIHRHEAWSTSHPPTKGPRAAAVPDMPAHVPIAGARNSPG